MMPSEYMGLSCLPIYAKQYILYVRVIWVKCQGGPMMPSEYMGLSCLPIYAKQYILYVRVIWVKCMHLWLCIQSTHHQSMWVYLGIPMALCIRAWHIIPVGHPMVYGAYTLSQSTVVYVVYPWVTQWCTAHIALSQSTYI